MSWQSDEIVSVGETIFSESSQNCGIITSSLPNLELGNSKGLAMVRRHALEEIKLYLEDKKRTILISRSN